MKIAALLKYPSRYLGTSVYIILPVESINSSFNSVSFTSLLLSTSNKNECFPKPIVDGTS